MPIFKLKLPCDDYYGEGSSFQEFFFEAEQCPTREQVTHYLTALLTEYQAMGGDYLQNIPGLQQCLTYIEHITKGAHEERLDFDRWPLLGGNLVQSNCYSLTKWGPLPITMTLIRPVKL